MRYPAQEDDYDVDIFNQNFAELSHIIENWKTISLINDLNTTKAGQGALDASQGKRLFDEMKNRIKAMHVLGGYIDDDGGVSPELAARGISLDDTVQAVYDKLENGSLTIIYTNASNTGYGNSLPTTEGSILFIYKHGSRGSLQFFGYRTGKSWTAGMRDGTFSGWKSCEGAPLINNLLTTGVGLGALDASLGNKLALMIEQSEIRANEKIAAAEQQLTASDGSQFRYGKTADGKPGYVVTGEDGADTVVPFSSNWTFSPLYESGITFYAGINYTFSEDMEKVLVVAFGGDNDSGGGVYGISMPPTAVVEPIAHYNAVRNGAVGTYIGGIYLAIVKNIKKGDKISLATAYISFSALYRIN